ncbi:hypothetical protein Pmar_PMAR020440 [Perkinsus marinus ATCC 50983]|uniref:Aminotransferase class V domain-containing protein n=1 Tax=Perkinsus marinus (strain ATCC 50983 / TXsc) TaxID=423536 RepID=C5L717_PERM5|nr:hypothetical protein Pmar_PMAR020440 [Perkinsus marinus ATCC 50983]EER07279.1 hypothetical protein Pmar_PMAR020440 [Perkinsus marinus ATCC 50983]|eukprot:XP_002775463.1 hypothetical protein Pmar_PMAR020440 [Perkinsus marinus ATCC 50983]
MTQEEVDLVADAILWIADNGWILLPSYTFKTRSGEWYHIRRDDRQKLKYLHYNFVAAVLNDLFGIQARGGCACAGPYAETILGLSAGNATKFEEAVGLFWRRLFNHPFGQGLN